MTSTPSTTSAGTAAHISSPRAPSSSSTTEFTRSTIPNGFPSQCCHLRNRSALCGAAPNSPSFIGGRALAGLGCSGIFSSVIVILIPLLPLHKRPMWQDFSAAIFGVSFVVGPLVGGALTNNGTRRWCFYLNLPIGGFSTMIVLLMLQVPSPKETSTPWKQQAIKLDPLLRWGGTQYAWDSGRIIALLVLFGVLSGNARTPLYLRDEIRNNDSTADPFARHRQASLPALSSLKSAITLLSFSQAPSLWPLPRSQRSAHVGRDRLGNAVCADKLPAVLTAYGYAFIVGTAMATLAFFGALAMEWRSVKKAKAEMMQQAKGGPGGPGGQGTVQKEEAKEPTVVDRVIVPRWRFLGKMSP
ncbi:hypothetical protein V1517DRAFT_341641 [Lipomyces orientalis]|uniref:Uncharacterized protein n=1 Tax=Lipomyces orientalis TaxID=1233043 RepID=A0ACC3TEV5_9ASCO